MTTPKGVGAVGCMLYNLYTKRAQMHARSVTPKSEGVHSCVSAAAVCLLRLLQAKCQPKGWFLLASHQGTAPTGRALGTLLGFRYKCSPVASRRFPAACEMICKRRRRCKMYLNNTEKRAQRPVPMYRKGAHLRLVCDMRWHLRKFVPCTKQV